MPDTPTIGELLELNAVTDKQINAAVREYLDDPTPGMRLIAKGVAIDVAAAVANHEIARDVLDDPALGDRARRIVVRTAILQARPA
ncbi:conserved hypothetical protein [Methylobacterium sp. 4-46]|uniref:hypothetical protein n=1 Tax=unclassified Methylobacterium TaxID=2615210 RepID=UPI000152BFCF|nr:MULTISPECIES: hypothetical protein [Methylobacterium]ACA18339.1 conserved hypothetical protein [Methylobacterium sp. 4-46]WFT77633.1 hypothetical protein QA634_20175 [Methylobacterium nodulans]